MDVLLVVVQDEDVVVVQEDEDVDLLKDVDMDVEVLTVVVTQVGVIKDEETTLEIPITVVDTTQATIKEIEDRFVATMV